MPVDDAEALLSVRYQRLEHITGNKESGDAKNRSAYGNLCQILPCKSL